MLIQNAFWQLKTLCCSKQQAQEYISQQSGHVYQPASTIQQLEIPHCRSVTDIMESKLQQAATMTITKDIGLATDAILDAAGLGMAIW